MAETMFIDNAAALLRVSRRTIYNYIKTGRLTTIRTSGGSQRVTIESVARVNAVLHAHQPAAGISSSMVSPGGFTRRPPNY